MSTQLCVDGDVDELVQVVVEDAGVEEGTDCHDTLMEFAFQVARMHTDLESTTTVETTEDDVIVTIKVPRV